MFEAQIGAERVKMPQFLLEAARGAAIYRQIMPDSIPLFTTTEDLAALCRRLAEHPFVTVDTEFMREQTFWPKLCLVQLAGPAEAAVVDPMASGINLQPFFDLMADKRIVKVFHAARQDIEIVHYKAGWVPVPVFDTQVAAMVCGFGDSISYVNLVKRITNQDLDKSSRFTDWTRRPLSSNQLHYALGDVTHLRDVYLHLKAELDKTGRPRNTSATTPCLFWASRHCTR